MLSSTQKEKLGINGAHDWDKPQQKADFNYNMGKRLKQRLRELKDLVLLLESLPDQVLENIKLIDHLPDVIKFVDVFLETASPLPIGKHASGEMRVFHNYANYMENHPEVDSLEKMGYIKSIDGKRYLINSDNWTASPAEIRNSNLIKNHVDKLQRYIDPSTVIISDKNERWLQADYIHGLRDQTRSKANMMGHCDLSLAMVKNEIPTMPPSQPRIIFEGEAIKEIEKES
jgi:hypothetical protein